MSHNVNIQGANIKDASVLQKAVQEFQNEGIRINLAQNTTMRGWGGNREKCDYVVQLPDHHYDVGFNVQKDGSLMPRVENDGSEIAKSLGVTKGAKTVDGAACNIRGPQAYIARLLQRCNVLTMEQQAAKNGYIPHRTTDAETGQIHLTVSAS